jgi:hypothetical protein
MVHDQSFALQHHPDPPIANTKDTCILTIHKSRLPTLALGFAIDFAASSGGFR